MNVCLERDIRRMLLCTQLIKPLWREKRKTVALASLYSRLNRGGELSAADEIRIAAESAGFTVEGDKELHSFFENVQEVKNAPLQAFIEACIARISAVDPNFLAKVGIDLSNAEAKLRKQMGDKRFEESNGYSFKQWLKHVAYFLETGNREELAHAVTSVKEALGQDES